MATLGEEVARRLREEAGRPQWRGYEQYDEAGEIVRVDQWPFREDSPGFPGIILVSGVGSAEPQTDWGERGVVPREGIWQYAGDGTPPVRIA